MLNRTKLLVAISLSVGIAHADQANLPIRLPIVLDGKDNVLLIDKEHRQVGALDLTFAYSFRKVEGNWIAIAYGKNGKQGYINLKGEWIYPPELDEARAFSDDGVARVKKGEKWGFIKPDGSFLITPKYEAVTPFSLSLAAVQDQPDGNLYYIDFTGKQAFKGNFSNAEAFADNGLAAVEIAEPVEIYTVSPSRVSKSISRGKTQWGYIDTSGNMVIPAQFKDAGSFNRYNIARVRNSANDSRIIDDKGNFVNDTVYELLWEFSTSGVAWSESKGNKNKYKGYINHKGEQVWETSYHNFHGERNGLLVDHRNGYKFYDPKGQVVIDEKSTWAANFDDPEVTLALRNRWGILSRSGEFTPFPDNIIAPLNNQNNQIVGFRDGLVAMLTEARSIVYFDRKGQPVYTFGGSSSNKMELRLYEGKSVWQSTVTQHPISSAIVRGIDDTFTDSSDLGKGIYQTITTLINSEPKPYYIPNPLYDEQTDPYKITDDLKEELEENEGLYKGAVKIIAESYVDEHTWGNFYFMGDYEYKNFKQYFSQITDLISSEYGAPSTKDRSTLVWTIKSKQLTLSHLSDSGDGDFYNQIVLEVNE